MQASHQRISSADAPEASGVRIIRVEHIDGTSVQSCGASQAFRGALNAQHNGAAKKYGLIVCNGAACSACEKLSGCLALQSRLNTLGMSPANTMWSDCQALNVTGCRMQQQAHVHQLARSPAGQMQPCNVISRVNNPRRAVVLRVHRHTRLWRISCHPVSGAQLAGPIVLSVQQTELVEQVADVVRDITPALLTPQPLVAGGMAQPVPDAAAASAEAPGVARVRATTA